MTTFYSAIEINHTDIHTAFWDAVAEVVTLVAAGHVIFLPTSQGKDSSVVSLIVLEAYRQALASGAIKSNHPLLMATVDTGGEVPAMTMYVHYCKSRIEQYCQEHGINLIYNIVKPELNDEYFVRFAGAQKLIPNPSRSGDCSVILKINPNQQYIKNMRKMFVGDMASYVDATIIACVGSRIQESARRSGNMAKTGLKKNLSELLADMENLQVGHNLKQFAPIRNWSTDDVFSLLRVAGSRPLSRHQQTIIPAFLSDFGLLIEIYGNGSQETCEIAIGNQSQGSGCNGKARFGCVYCTQVATKDKSVTALSALPRWESIGIKDALRVRDWLFRLSCNTEARSLYARAYDPVVYNRVALQPGIMKPKYLEKMVRYAAQLTIDSQQTAKDFRKLVEQGREMEHPGYRDIAEDIYLPPKTKKAFLVMYKESLQNPECLNNLFSERHAIMLSFRWALDGVGAAPFRPLAIWEQIKQGKGRIPYPALNEELLAQGVEVGLETTTPLPEAVMMPVYKNEDLMSFCDNPVDLLAHWQRPATIADLLDKETSCSLNTVPEHLLNLSVDVKHEVAVIDNMETDVADAVLTLNDQSIGVVYKGFTCRSTKMNNRSIDSDMLADFGLDALAKNSYLAKLNKATKEKTFETLAELDQLLASLTDDRLKPALAYFETIKLTQAYGSNTRAKVAPSDFTRRRFKMQKGRIVKGLTRIRFYQMDQHSSLHHACVKFKEMAIPNFHVHQEAFISAVNINEAELNSNIFINDCALMMWEQDGGKQTALEMHDNYIRYRRNNKSFSRGTLRDFGGTGPAEMLMRNGVVSIKSQYMPQMLTLLHRTHIMDSLGLLSLQSSSMDEVAAHPKAISMAQHRKDKAMVLTEIRRRRNAERHRIITQRNAMAAGKTDDIVLTMLNSGLDTITHQVELALKAIVHQQLSHQFKVRFHTSDIPCATQANAYRLWLDLYLNDVEKCDDIYKLLLPGEFAQRVNTSPELKLQITKAITKTLQQWASMINTACGQWLPLVDELGKLSSPSRADYQATLEAHAPIILDPVYHYWKPSAANLQFSLAKQVKASQQILTEMTQLAKRWSKLSHQGLGKARSKLTLAEKLQIMRKAA